MSNSMRTCNAASLVHILVGTTILPLRNTMLRSISRGHLARSIRTSGTIGKAQKFLGRKPALAEVSLEIFTGQQDLEAGGAIKVNPPNSPHNIKFLKRYCTQSAFDVKVVANDDGRLRHAPRMYVNTATSRHGIPCPRHIGPRDRPCTVRPEAIADRLPEDCDSVRGCGLL